MQLCDRDLFSGKLQHPSVTCALFETMRRIKWTEVMYFDTNPPSIGSGKKCRCRLGLYPIYPKCAIDLFLLDLLAVN